MIQNISGALFGSLWRREKFRDVLAIAPLLIFDIFLEASLIGSLSHRVEIYDIKILVKE